MTERPGAQILNHMVSNLIVDMVHKPLGYGCKENTDQDIADDAQQSLKIHQPFVDDQIHASAGQDGNIEGQNHRG